MDGPPATLALDRTATLLVLAGALLLAVGLWAGIRLARRVLRRRAATSRETGRAGEARGIALLRRAGYRVIRTQVTATGTVEVDGVPHAYVVRADALVRRRWRRYVAELKGGVASATALCRETRRQLREYAAVFDVHGVLLVDAERSRIQRIRFP